MSALAIVGLVGAGWLVVSVVAGLAVGKAVHGADERDGARGLRGEK